jgi:hypothetical protein
MARSWLVLARDNSFCHRRCASNACCSPRSLKRGSAVEHVPYDKIYVQSRATRLIDKINDLRPQTSSPSVSSFDQWLARVFQDSKIRCRQGFILIPGLDVGRDLYGADDS